MTRALNRNMSYKYDVVWKSKLECLQGKELEILKLHIDDKVPVARLAKIYGCDRKPIQNIIKKNGFDTRPSTSPELDGREEEIIKMYVEDELTIQTIRKVIGCTFNTIKGFLLRNSISLRTATESRNTEDGKPKPPPQRLTTPVELEDAVSMYNNGEVLEKIGEKYGISPRGLQMKFRKMGIPMRTLTESANLPTTYERKKETNIKNWGVENPMQNEEIYNKSNINRYKFKAVDINGRRFSHLQGYEPQGIEYLIDVMNIDVCDIQSGRKVPKIRYSYQDKNKMYYPDLYVENLNLLVEVKCQYTYDNDLEKNIIKREASIKNGYKFLTIIFDNSGRNINKVF